MLDEFKQFIARGNVVDLAVGVIIGATFGKIVTSVVEDLLMPPIAAITGSLDFSNMYLPLSHKVRAAVASSPNGLGLADAKKIGPVLAYGSFFTVLINFLIVAFCIFLVIKTINSFLRREAARPSTPPVPTRQEVLLEEIRDLLKSRAA